MLGLPPDLPVEPAKGKNDDLDAQASKKADMNSSLVARVSTSSENLLQIAAIDRAVG